jgi:hypothetical protein
MVRIVTLPPPPPPPWQPVSQAPGYPVWPPAEPRRRRFVWWEAFVGLASPFVASVVLYLAGGFVAVFDALPFLFVAGLVASGVLRRWTLLASIIAGSVLMVGGLLVWFTLFVLLDPRIL